jgi:hypothetical protein
MDAKAFDTMINQGVHTFIEIVGTQKKTISSILKNNIYEW